MKKLFAIIFISLCILISGCVQENQQLPNPASKNCIDKGGSLAIKDEANGQAGYCTLKNGTVCEEWALFRGECPKNNSGTGTQIANPASTNCINKGGTLKIEKDSSSGEIGMCTLPDGTVCEEWVLYRGECKNLTQIANPASVNCINLGGTLEIRNEANGQAGYCTLKNGTVCEEWALFRGECSASNSMLTKEACEAGGGIFDSSTLDCKCGGFIQNAPTCPSNYYCQLNVNSPDTGGVCKQIPAMTEELCNASRGHWAQIVIDPRQACLDRGETNCPAAPARISWGCKCGGIAGFGCPAGYECADYLPSAQTPDAMGTCKAIGS